MFKKKKGQSLVETALVLPFLLIIFFAIVEVGRAWHAYEGAKLAAMDGAYSAAVTQNASTGIDKIRSRLDEAKLIAENWNVTEVRNPANSVVGYEASVQIRFVPLINMTLPTVSGPQGVLPSGFTIAYQDIYYNTIY